MALGVVGLLCAALGAVMIVVVPSLIEQQVLKVGRALTPGRGSGVGAPARDAKPLARGSCPPWGPRTRAGWDGPRTLGQCR